MWSSLAAVDIETDTSALTPDELAAGWVSRGLDPAITAVTAIAVARPGVATLVLSGDEAEILVELDQLLTQMPPGLLLTWNGSVFDLPFLHDRAALLGLTLGLRLWHDPQISAKHSPLPGHPGGYAAVWGSAYECVPHAHLDVAYALRSYAWDAGVPWALKPVARSQGLAPVEVDREAMHLLSDAELAEYVASDAEVTLELGRRVLSGSFSC